MIETIDILLLGLTVLAYICATLYGLFAAAKFLTLKLLYSLNTLLGLTVLTAGTMFCLSPLLMMHARYDDSDRMVHIAACLVDLALIYLFLQITTTALARMRGEKTDEQVP